MRITALMLTLCLLLAGCAIGQQPGTSPPAPTAPGDRLLLVVYDTQGGTIRPVDGLSLADLPGYQPLSVGHHFSDAFSPDGKTLAAFIWPGGDGAGGVLHLIDTQAWTDRTTGLLVDTQVEQPLFSRDGKTIYWLQPGGSDSAHGLPREYALVRYSVGGSGGAERIVQLPASFMPYAYKLVGDRLAVYGLPTDAENQPEDAPHVMLVDIVRGRIAADIRLDGVVAGNQRTGDGSFLSYDPGIAWDVPHSKLYVAEAATDRITVVDLAAGKVLKQEAVRPRTSLGDRLRNWLLPTAEAKLMAGVFRRALLSPDGSRLYRFGRRSDTPPAEVLLPLQAVATADMVEGGGLDLVADDVAVSPDGRHLLAAGARNELVQREGNSAAVNQVGVGISLIDAAQMKRLAQVQPGAMFWVDGFSRDSRQAYVDQVPEPGKQGPVVLRRFDLGARDLAASRVLGEGGGHLIGLASDR